MKENAGFILTFTAMMAAIALLHGCTRLGLEDTSIDDWTIRMSATADACIMELHQRQDVINSDDSITLDAPKGKQ